MSLLSTGSASGPLREHGSGSRYPRESAVEQRERPARAARESDPKHSRSYRSTRNVTHVRNVTRTPAHHTMLFAVDYTVFGSVLNLKIICCFFRRVPARISSRLPEPGPGSESNVSGGERFYPLLPLILEVWPVQTDRYRARGWI